MLKMVKLIDLPTELLWTINDHLERKDLRHLISVCRALQRLTEPSLYREIASTISISQILSAHGPVHLLLRSILERQELGRHVEKLSVQGVQSQTFWRAQYNEHPLTTHEFDLAGRLIHAAGLPSEPWMEKLSTGDFNTCLALLILQLPNLQVMNLDLDRPLDRHMLPGLVGHALFAAPPLASLSKFDDLRSVAFEDIGTGWDHKKDDEGTGDVESHLALFYLPSIESIRVSLPQPRIFAWPCGKARPRASTLTTLCLNGTRLQPDRLDEILSATPNLIDLTYDFWCETDPACSWKSTYLDCAKLGQAIERVPLLQRLRIGVEFYSSSCPDLDVGGSCESGDAWGLKGQFGRVLNGLGSLEELSIPMVVLPGWSTNWSIMTRLSNVLPPHRLRLLRLTSDLNDWSRYEWSRDIRRTLILDYLLDHCGGDDPRFSRMIENLKAEVPPSIYPLRDDEWEDYDKNKDGSEQDDPEPPW